MMKNKFSLFRVVIALMTLALCGGLIAAVIYAISTRDPMAGLGVMLSLIALPVLVVGGYDIAHE